MTTVSILRIAGGGLSRGLFKKSFPLTSITGVQKQNLSLTPISKARVYGPKDEEEKPFTAHWSRERYLILGMIPLAPLAIAVPHPALDMALCTAMVLHSYWSLDGVVTDYFHSPILNATGHGILLALSVLAFTGLTYLNYNDIGFARMVRRIYSEL